MTKNASISLTLERLWQFSLQYYSVRGIKEACLSLQNKYHGNVNLLLLLKWLDEQKLCFAEESWHKVQHALSRSESLLLHYRELRKQYKTHLPDTLYRKSLEFELMLEKQQQSDLVDCINSISLTENPGLPMTQLYCHQLGADDLAEEFSGRSSQ